MSKQYLGRFNYRAFTDPMHPDIFDPPELRETQGGTLTVDGVVIEQVWYADTTEGVVKTYDLDGTNKICALVVAFDPALFPGKEIEAFDCGPGFGFLLSRTLRGKVEIFGKSDGPEESRAPAPINSPPGT